jgi:3-methylcrotonyl-CoA carboxylase alpha subunit
MKIRKLLIANRGEIACRVMATAKRLGIATVAVYSEADAGSRHAALADEAIAIGPAAAKDSYLSIPKIIAAARASGATAIHPGYGFLAENAEFAEACAAAGIIFVGPPPAAIRAMGLKDAAKALMEKAKVPVVPGYHGAEQDAAKLAKAAAKIGWPVLLKPVAGGGGKGMRRVDAAADFDLALAACRREAASAFGDDRVLVEKYLTQPRHIEIQVFADSQGNAVHLFERDCSVQRRHQKVIEEAPAPDMPKAMRAAMGKAAVQAAKAIGYVGAGTVEFIADVSEGLQADRFYFMEMNTRLQVEHPVTEMITGQDLVEWQLRVAAGEPLPLAQDELAISGHAVEARLYAEDPDRDFLPSPGRLHHMAAPAEGAGLRIDTGVRQGDVVTPYYDPMIAKVIAWDRDRAGAIRRLAQALAGYRVAGVATNAAFLIGVLEHPAFIAGEVDTGFIERHRRDLLPERGPASDRVLAIAALGVLLSRARDAQARAATSGDPYSPWHRVDGWRLNDEGHDVLRFKDAGREVPVTVHYRPGGAAAFFGMSGAPSALGGYQLDLPGGAIAVRGELSGDGALRADLAGVRVEAAVHLRGHDITVMMRGGAHRLALFDPLDVGELDEGAVGAIAAPMSGKIIQVMVESGAAVAKGKPLLILEAMKMEHTIAAPHDGVVEKVNVAAGEQVSEGAMLIKFAEPKA